MLEDIFIFLQPMCI